MKSKLSLILTISGAFIAGVLLSETVAPIFAKIPFLSKFVTRVEPDENQDED